jgi:hypothetical protein
MKVRRLYSFARRNHTDWATKRGINPRRGSPH